MHPTASHNIRRTFLSTPDDLRWLSISTEGWRGAESLYGTITEVADMGAWQDCVVGSALSRKPITK